MITYTYITKMVVLVSEPVRGRYRATELPCFSRLGVLIMETDFFVLVGWGSQTDCVVLVGWGSHHEDRLRCFSRLGFSS